MGSAIQLVEGGVGKIGIRELAVHAVFSGGDGRRQVPVLRARRSTVFGIVVGKVSEYCQWLEGRITCAAKWKLMRRMTKLNIAYVHRRRPEASKQKYVRTFRTPHRTYRRLFDVRSRG